VFSSCKGCKNEPEGEGDDQVSSPQASGNITKPDEDNPKEPDRGGPKEPSGDSPKEPSGDCPAPSPSPTPRVLTADDIEQLRIAMVNAIDAAKGKSNSPFMDARTAARETLKATDGPTTDEEKWLINITEMYSSQYDYALGLKNEYAHHRDPWEASDVIKKHKDDAEKYKNDAAGLRNAAYGSIHLVRVYRLATKADALITAWDALQPLMELADNAWDAMITAIDAYQKALGK
jgi:hypothetical protein